MKKLLRILLAGWLVLCAGCGGGPVKLYADVRKEDLSTLDARLEADLIETLWFNQTTRWPAGAREIAEAILEKGKNPGLGVRGLHAAGLTGKGVRVAIIDQNLAGDHAEFAGKIEAYKDFGTNQPADEGSMHAPAVASLLAGSTTGTAPDVRVTFAATPSWLNDSLYFADALDWIIAQNAALPADDKIRVVSVSASLSGPGSGFKNQDAWDAAYQRALDAGLLVLDCSEKTGITAACTLDLDDPENPARCIPGYPGKKIPPRKERIYIPTSHRTTAEAYRRGADAYQYTGQGGLSWSVPYLAGVLALGWQLRPDLSGEELLELIFESATLVEGDLRVINPVGFIELVKQAGE
jgi:subtilisin family serine protease